MKHARFDQDKDQPASQPSFYPLYSLGPSKLSFSIFESFLSRLNRAVNLNGSCHHRNV